MTVSALGVPIEREKSSAGDVKTSSWIFVLLPQIKLHLVALIGWVYNFNECDWLAADWQCVGRLFHADTHANEVIVGFS